MVCTLMVSYGQYPLYPLWSVSKIPFDLFHFNIQDFFPSESSALKQRTSTNQTPNCQEVADGKRVLCASVLLNDEPELLQQRIGNAVYDRCRAKTLSLAGFPDYDPLIVSLRESTPTGTEVVYKVCAVRHDKLLVLQSLTRRWLEFEGTRDEAHAIVEAHNKKFNPDGEFLENDERTHV